MADPSALTTSWPRAQETDWCLFLDRDGVLNRRVVGDYVRSWDDFEFLPGSVEAVACLSRWAPHLVVVSNQQGIGKGLMSAMDVDDIHVRMRGRVGEAGGRVDDVLVCPHLVSDACPCRKPGTGLADEWLSAHPTIRPEKCVVVGDAVSDMRMGRSLTHGAGLCIWIGVPPPELERVDYDVAFPDLAGLAAHVDSALMAREGQ